MQQRQNRRKPPARKSPRRAKRRPPSSRHEADALAADAILRQAGEHQLADRAEYEGRDGPRLLARGGFTDQVTDETPDLTVTTEPTPEKVIGVIERGPNGRRCVLLEGERIKERGFVLMQEYEAPSRSIEGTFRGPADMVNEVARRLTLTQGYFRRWLHETRPRMSARAVENAARIGERFIAESSSCLVYLGRYVPPEREATERRPDRRKRPALAVTAAACRISAATVRRVIRDLTRFRCSALYREQAARLDAAAGNPASL